MAGRCSESQPGPRARSAHGSVAAEAAEGRQCAIGCRCSGPAGPGPGLAAAGSIPSRRAVIWSIAGPSAESLRIGSLALGCGAIKAEQAVTR